MTTDTLTMGPDIKEDILLLSPEKETQIRDTLTTINYISGAVGKSLPVASVEGPEELRDEPGVYLLHHPELASTISGVRFDFDQNLLSGSADSAHAVLKGDLVVERSPTNDDDTSTHTVAVKNFEKRTAADNMQRALREIQVMKDLEEKGEVTFSPLGLVVAPENGITSNEIILLTAHDSSILTMDNNPWKAGFSVQNIDNAKEASTAVARFNRMGYFHQDAKIKNVAQSEIGGTGMIDYETTEDIDVTNPEQVAEAALVDFSTLINSLHKKGLFGKSDNPREIRQVLEELGSSYLSVWGDSGREVQDAVIESVDSAIEQYGILVGATTEVHIS